VPRSLQLGHVALGEGRARWRDRAGNPTPAAATRPSSAPATVRRSRDSRARWPARDAAAAVRRSAACCSHSGRPNSEARVRVRAIEPLAQRAVVGILQDRQVTGRVQRQLVAGFTSACAARVHLQRIGPARRRAVRPSSISIRRRWSHRARSLQSESQAATAARGWRAVAPSAGGGTRRRQGEVAQLVLDDPLARAGSAEKSPRAAIALYLPYSASFCASSVQNVVSRAGWRCTGRAARGCRPTR